MDSRHFIATGLLLLTFTSGATGGVLKSCPDDLPVGELSPGTTFELKETVKIALPERPKLEQVRESNKDDYDYSTLRILWADGKAYKYGNAIEGSIEAISRTADVTFNASRFTNPEKFKKTGKIEKFKCSIISPAEKPKDQKEKSSIIAVINLDQKCPMGDELTLSRAKHGFRFEKELQALTLNDLREALGPRFVIRPKCNSDSAPPGPRTSENTKKPGFPTNSSRPSAEPGPGQKNSESGSNKAGKLNPD